MVLISNFLELFTRKGGDKYYGLLLFSTQHQIYLSEYLIGTVQLINAIQLSEINIVTFVGMISQKLYSIIKTMVQLV